MDFVLEFCLVMFGLYFICCAAAEILAENLVKKQEQEQAKAKVEA